MVLSSSQSVRILAFSSSREKTYTEYATETGRFGGAYLYDSDGDGRDEFYPVHDPRVFGPRRLFRVGLGVEF